MPESSSPPLSRRVQAKVMGIVNIPMRRILKLPFPTPVGKRLMLIYLTGRRTAKQYRQPVSYVRDGTVLLTPGPLLEKMIAANPMVNRFVGIPRTPDGRLDPDQLALAVNYGHATAEFT